MSTSDSEPELLSELLLLRTNSGLRSESDTLLGIRQLRRRAGPGLDPAMQKALEMEQLRTQGPAIAGDQVALEAKHDVSALGHFPNTLRAGVEAGKSASRRGPHARLLEVRRVCGVVRMQVEGQLIQPATETRVLLLEHGQLHLSELFHVD
eukprot:766607-Hanusia_phi.AAC.1